MSKSNYSEKDIKDLMAILDGTANSPEAMARIRQKIGDKALGNFLNLGANVMDIGISQSQINKADLLESQLKRPDIYSPTRGDEALRAGISDAQRGIYDTKAQLAPAELVNMENYFNDLNNAKIASGGQASAYGSLAQGASLRRQRGGNQLASMNAGLVAQNQKRYDSLLGMQLENNNQFENRSLAANQLQLADYYKQAEANALLGSTGRSNLRNSIYNTIPAATESIKSVRSIGRSNYDKDPSKATNQFGQSIQNGIMNMFNKTSNYRPEDMARFGNGAVVAPEVTMNQMYNGYNMYNELGLQPPY